jgi:NitT/TauT family transport system substrate-binding protein
MKRLISLLGLVVVVLSGGVPARAAEPTKLSFQLDWHPNVQFAGLLLAHHRGWYREAGLDVTLVPVDTEMKVVSTVTSGGAWLGCSESGVLIAARAGGAKIRAVGTMLQGSPMGLISLRSRGFDTLASLRGHRIGIHPDGRKALELVIAHAGLKTSEFTIVEKDHDLTPLLNGDCDAVQGYSIDEAVALESRGTPIHFIPFHEHGYRAYSQVYFGSESCVNQHRDVVARFLEVSNRGWRAAIADPVAASRVVVEHFAPKLDREYQRRSLEAVGRLAVLETGIDGLGRMKPETWKAALANFSTWQVVTPPLDDSWIDYGFMPPAPAATSRKPL